METEFPRVSEVRPLQPAKASLPIVMTLLGIIIEVRPVQTQNEQLLIEVTEMGIITDVSVLQPVNAWSPNMVQERNPELKMSEFGKA